MMTSGIAVFLLVAGIVCGEITVEEMKAKISLLEASQETLQTDYARLQEKLQDAEQAHERDVQNVRNSCQEFKNSAEQEVEDLQSKQQSLLDRLPSVRNKTHPAALEGPCMEGSHTLLDDHWRSPDRAQVKSEKTMCDSKLAHGWYRFLINGSNAVIPTSCVPKNHCQTHAPQWMNLREQSLPEPGQQIEALACAHWNGLCCNWNTPLSVRNCGDYFVYKLEPDPDLCSLAFCAEPQQ